jgi:D-glycero-D-manno-heptose 1,7-bisphosphate phosphatase
LPAIVIVDRESIILAPSAAGMAAAPAAWTPLSGSLEAIARLNHAGVSVALAGNEPAVGDGVIELMDLNRIHAKLYRSLARVGGHIDGIFFCAHASDARCQCRLPATGLLETIAQRFGVSLLGVPVIASSMHLLAAGASVGARPLRIAGNGKGIQPGGNAGVSANGPQYPSLDRAVAALIDGETSSC